MCTHGIQQRKLTVRGSTITNVPLFPFCSIVDCIHLTFSVPSLVLVPLDSYGSDVRNKTKQSITKDDRYRIYYFYCWLFFSVLKSSAALRNYLRCSNKLWVTAEWRSCSSGGLYLQVDLRKQNLCVSWPLLQDELGGTHLKTPSVTNQNRGWGVGLTRNFSLIVKKCFPLNLTWEVGKVS